MEFTRKQLAGGAAGLVVAAIGGGLLLADFVRTDTFDFYKQPHASSYPVREDFLAAADPIPMPVQPAPAITTPRVTRASREVMRDDALDETVTVVEDPGSPDDIADEQEEVESGAEE